jgi:hypothetical protein
MNDFEEKYSLLVKYMLPTVSKCINSVEFDGFVSGRESLGVRNPKDDYERRMNDRFAEYLTPKIVVRLDDKCKGGRAMGLKEDVAGKLSEIHHTFFEDRKLNANSNYIYMFYMS